MKGRTVTVRPAPTARPGPAERAVPPRLQRALDSLTRWGERGVHLVPVRHHSPACSLALTALLAEVRPATVLIEGPAEYTAALPALQDPRTVPPVAVLSLSGPGATYYPLAEFSPEWVALRWAGRHDATAAFIDLDAAARPSQDNGVARTLQAEYHLARSAAIAELARRLGCRDHDEVWEHLFEDRDSRELTEWRRFFTGTLAWAGLARLDADREVLDADATHAREAVMVKAIRDHLPGAGPHPGRGGASAEPRNRPEAHTGSLGAPASDGPGGLTDPGVRPGSRRGPVVVVTGAFHTLALLEALDGAPEAAWLPRPEESRGGECWLVRYDFARLDSLGGYGAGIPSPSFWARAWRARTATPGAGPGGLVTDVVLDVVAALRELGEPVGTAHAQAAVDHALGLAALRGRAWPGRTDLLDALNSCLVKDDTGVSGNLGEAVTTVFADRGLGQVPPLTASPPLVERVRREAESLRLNLTDSSERRTNLDTARNPSHRRKREFLARTRFAGLGFARQVGGADLVAGVSLGQLVEQWVYAWTPAVETVLVRASQTAPTLEALVLEHLAERLGDEPTLPELTKVLTELVVMGMDEDAARLSTSLEAAISQAGDLDELVDALHTTTTLVQGTGRAFTGALAPRLAATASTGLATAAYLLSDMAGLTDDEADVAVDTLASLRDLLTRLGPEQAGRQDVLREVEALRRNPGAPAVLAGACTGIAASTGGLPARQVSDAVTAQLCTGADPGRVAGFLVGLLRTSPDVVLHDRDTLVAVTAALTSLSEESFMAVLPDLRRGFTTLRPIETHRLAEQVAGLTGTQASEIDVVWDLDAGLAELGQHLEHQLVAGLERDGLGQWVAQ